MLLVLQVTPTPAPWGSWLIPLVQCYLPVATSRAQLHGFLLLMMMMIMLLMLMMRGAAAACPTTSFPGVNDSYRLNCSWCALMKIRCCNNLSQLDWSNLIVWCWLRWIEIGERSFRWGSCLIVQRRIIVRRVVLGRWKDTKSTWTSLRFETTPTIDTSTAICRMKLLMWYFRGSRWLRILIGQRSTSSMPLKRRSVQLVILQLQLRSL